MRLGGALLILACLAIAARGEDPWMVKDAPWRAAIDAKEAPKNADAGYGITLPEFGQTRADMADILLTDTAGQPVPVATIYRREGQSVLLVAQSLEAGKRYYVYFGGNFTRRGPPWTPKLSLVMETRRAPAAAVFADWPSLKKAWHDGASDGAGFAAQIYQGENLYGESTDFLTHYTGYLLTSGTETMQLYTLSSDASFVLVNDQYAFGWPGKHSPDSNEGSVASKEVTATPDLTKIDYFAAKGGDGPPPAMVLGWRRDGKFQTISADAWLHPGRAEVQGIEEAHHAPVPVVTPHFLSYMGYEGLWYYETNFTLPVQNLAGWTAQWKFSDGATVAGNDCTRVLVGNAPMTVTAQLQRGGTAVAGERRISFPGNVSGASIRDPASVEHYLNLIDTENAAQLSPGVLQAEFRFVRAFGSDRQAGRLADALLAQGKPVMNDSLWPDVELAHLRLLSQTDPQGTLAQLHQVDGATWKKYERAFDSFELDLLAFRVRDVTLVNRASQIAFLNPNTDLAALAKVRVGDLYRALGRYKEAVAQFQQLGVKIDLRAAPAQDRAYSITVNEMLEKNDRDDAAAKLQEWELRHPMAEFDSDFLLLRGRTLMAFGRWNEALSEFESFEKIQPESSFGIDAEFYRARALYELGHKDEARKMWTGIAQNYPKHELAEESKQWAAKP